MIIDALLLGLLLTSLVGIGWIIFRKFPVLASIDLQATIAHTDAKKISLLEQRLRRKMVGVFTRAKSVSQPIVRGVATVGKSAQKKLVDLEHEYKVRGLPVLMSRLQKKKVAEEIGEICSQAQALADDGETVAAEEKALQAIRLDPRSVPAFELLGRLYFSVKEYGQAKEIYLYLIKLATDPQVHAEHDDDQGVEAAHNLCLYYADLAQAYLGLEDHDGAFDAISRAVALEDCNPKILDAYIDIAICTCHKLEAQEAVDKIKTVNPDNGRIPEWEEKITAIDNLHHHNE